MLALRSARAMPSDCQLASGPMEQRLLMQAFSQSQEAILVTDHTGCIVMANPAYQRISGYTLDEVRGWNPRLQAARCQPDDFYQKIRDAVRTCGSWQGEIRSCRKDGSDYPEWLTVSGLFDTQGRLSHYVATFTDMTEQKASQDKIMRLSLYDAVTGLPNRRWLVERCAQAIRQHQHSHGSLALLALGLDDHEATHNALGHARMEQVLQALAQRLLSLVPEKVITARVADDGFVLLLPGCTRDMAAHAAKTLAQELNRPFAIGPIPIRITGSVGVALYPAHGAEVDDLLEAADTAMLHARQSGRGKWAFFDDDMRRHAMAHANMVAALSRGIQLDQLRLHYQPFADLRTGQITGMEALLRWNHPELGEVSPAVFIPLAERSGLILEIGAWVIDSACRDIRFWLDRGVRVPPVAVNISPVQFRDPDLLWRIGHALQRHGLKPQHLSIEVTEGALMEDVAHGKELLRAIRQMGLQVSLDDFGTGYSSLSYLKQLPFDKVKIDQSFVRGLCDCAHDAMIAKVVIAMAHGLGLSVLAEGVETEAQCTFLRANQCDHMQGYLFSRPVPKMQLLQLLQEGRRLPEHLLALPRPTRTLLLMDRDPDIVAALTGTLPGDGYHILAADDAEQALQLLGRRQVDVVIAEQHLPETDGLSFLEQVRRHHPDIVRILLAGQEDLQAVGAAINQGTVNHLLAHPWNAGDLRRMTEDAFRLKELAEENRLLSQRLRAMAAGEHGEAGSSDAKDRPGPDPDTLSMQDLEELAQAIA